MLYMTYFSLTNPIALSDKTNANETLKKNYNYTQ